MGVYIKGMKMPTNWCVWRSEIEDAPTIIEAEED